LTTPNPVPVASPWHSPPWLQPRGAYVHVPFCAHHCDYCDFAIVTGREHQISLYLEAIACELATLGTPRPVETIFLGGGTPSLLSTPQLARLLEHLREWLVLRPGGELTIEANPDDVTRDKLRMLVDAGLTRISLGVQSFRPDVLRTLNRRHRTDEVFASVALARELVPAMSLDLIFGVPGQSLADWQGDIDRAISLEPDHISCYGLTWEKGTPLWKRWAKTDEIAPIDEDSELAMYLAVMDALEGAGYAQYEISNFAKPGAESRHNRLYWANRAYYGFGPGAARYVDGTRELNTRSLDEYLRRCLSGESPTFQSETLPAEERARETLAMMLRRREGIARGEFLTQTGFALETLIGRVLAGHVGAGLLADDGESVSLTRAGRCVADGLEASLWAG